MKVIQKKKFEKEYIGENLLYFMVWSAIILVPILASKMLGEEHVNLQKILISWRKISPYLFLFVINNALLAPKLLLKRRYAAYVAISVIITTIIFSIVDGYERYLIRNAPDIETMIEARKASFTDLALQWNILLGLFMISANSMIKLLYRNMRAEQEMISLRHENLQAEIDYLKYQINPHFFMNTLNNIHALIDIDTREAQGAVIELSKMMRYVLYESGQERITLEQDLRFVENYVRLMQIRYAEELDIRIRYPQEEVEQLKIPPLLLIVFVENAFKHGVSGNRPSFIHIDVEISPQKEVLYRVKNSLQPQKPDHKPGIGLRNVRKRLDLIYDTNYSLEMRSEESAYVVELKIPTL